jgi:hypothetical protein
LVSEALIMTRAGSVELHDLFRFENGDRVRTPGDWPRRRKELLDLILDIEYGRLPPTPAHTEAEELFRGRVGRLLNARRFQYHLVTGPDGRFSFLLDVLIPEGDGRFPVIIDGAAHWLSPRLRAYVGREEELPFDQHAVKALIAPRALLTTEALADLWANPTGTWQTHLAAREVYRFLGVESRIGISYREGPHAHLLADWEAFLDFADWQFRGQAPARRFDACPFPDLPPAFSWSAPPSQLRAL